MDIDKNKWINKKYIHNFYYKLFTFLFFNLKSTSKAEVPWPRNLFQCTTGLQTVFSCHRQPCLSPPEASCKKLWRIYFLLYWLLLNISALMSESNWFASPEPLTLLSLFLWIFKVTGPFLLINMVTSVPLIVLIKAIINNVVGKISEYCWQKIIFTC